MLRSVLTVFLLIEARVYGYIPAAMLGTWSGNMTQSQLGPLSEDLPPPRGWSMPLPRVGTVEISAPDASDNFFMRQLWGTQLFRIQNGLMQYCFRDGVDEAPFMLASNSSSEVKFCWRGPRLPTHKANCTGCDCAQWSLHIDSEDVLHSIFMMSPPVVHLRMDLIRRGPPPSPEQVASGWKCHFNNHTGAYNRTSSMAGQRQFQKQSPMHSREFLQSHDQAEVAVHNSNKLGHCVMLNLKHRVRLEYVVAKLPCTPCDVNFSIAAETSESEYVAVGFKGFQSEYHEAPIVPDLPDYWGMSTSIAAQHEYPPLSGRIVLAHSSNASRGCVREMRADTYVGSVIDVPHDGVVQNKVISRSGGQTQFKFTVNMNAARNAADLDWQGYGAFGSLRVMWAIGSVADGGCQAQLDYHGAARGLAHLDFPMGYVACDKLDDTTPEIMSSSMLNSDAVVVV